MNVHLQKSLILLFWVLALPIWLGAQVELTTFEAIPLATTFTSDPLYPQPLQAPQEGVYTIRSLGGSSYELRYAPNEGFIGTDVIRLRVWQGGGNLVILTYNITVAENRVEAERDLATTQIATPVQINVLDNDFSTNGILKLDHIALTNHGEATIEPGGRVIYTPSPGFSGLAHLNYVVCNDRGGCDLGTVSVYVVPPGGLPTDTIRIFTNKDEEQVVLTPDGYTFSNGPFHGVYDMSMDVPIYKPSPGFVGTDYLSFDYMGAPRVVAIQVLDNFKNQYVHDDYFDAPLYQSTELNVLENDAAGAAGASCFQIVNGPQHGSLVEISPGVLSYRPDDGFFGIDEFTYSGKDVGCTGHVEIAKVRLFTGFFDPHSTVYDMSTAKKTPLIIRNESPVDNYRMIISSAPQMGSAYVATGQTINVNGNNITANHAVIYVPNDNISSGQDDLEIRYQILNGHGGVQASKTVKVRIDILDVGSGNGPSCYEDCIWMGDANSDGIVDMDDLLTLGEYLGEIGPQRSDQSGGQWYGLDAVGWNTVTSGTANGIDFKHLDADGDGRITSADTAAISLYYGGQHGLVPNRTPYFDYTIQLSSDDLFPAPGQEVVLSVSLGREDDIAYDVYGFTYPFHYDPAYIDANSVNMRFFDQSWLAYNSPILYMQRNDGYGRLEAGFTRTSRISASGYGEIGKLSFIVSDDIAGIRDSKENQRFPLVIPDSRAIVRTRTGESKSVLVKGLTLYVQVPESEQTAENSSISLSDESKVLVAPNPSSGNFNVKLGGQQIMERIQVISVSGKIIYDSGRIEKVGTQINLDYSIPGLYFVNVHTKDGVMTQKIQITP